MQEIWKPVTGYENKYIVSNYGEIKSIQFKRHFIKKQHVGSHGYPCVGSTSRNKDIVIRKILLVHRVVAKAFIPNPYNKKEVNHKNGIKTDYSIQNLEWVTPSENQKHSYKVLGNRSCLIAAKKAKEKLSKKICKYDKEMNKLKEYYSINDAAKDVNKNHSHISQCCNFKRKTAYGFIWRFI
jgi:hypothetical protein